jgi:hypothetical protein
MWREDTVVFRDGYGDGRNGARWISADDGECSVYRDSELRPLVVIDPEQVAGRHGASYIARLLREADENNDIPTFSALADAFDPKPPKPDEPTGLGAVVEAVYDNRFVRIDRGSKAWRRVGDIDPSATCSWGDIEAVRVLSEGVPA